MFTYKDNTNKDDYRTLDEWLEITKDWTDPYGQPQVINHKGIDVVRDDLIVGTKARACDFVIQNVKEDTIVYIAPREGAAPVSLLDAAKRYNKTVKLFMPACKKMSDTQSVAVERGADVEFYRIAAMPNLKKVAEQWAKDNNAFFVPLGLKHENATAALIRVGYNLYQSGFRPDSMVVATSTGVLIRSLQIAMPETKFTCLAVSRNIQEGEKGPAHFETSTLPFLKDSKFECPFPTYDNYDRKAWEYAVTNNISSMWNVATKPVLQNKDIWKTVESNVPWANKKVIKNITL